MFINNLFLAEKKKTKGDKEKDKNKKSGFVVNKQARAMEEEEVAKPSKKSSKKTATSTPKVFCSSKSSALINV